MLLIIVSFLAWVLTVLAPCVLPLLPIILWWSLENTKDKLAPYVIIISLWISVFLFSIILKTTTIFISLPSNFWSIFSWVLIFFLWIITLFPDIWKKLWDILGFSKKSNDAFSYSTTLSWNKKNIFMGLSLWPIFSSCSPTYAIILAVILPSSFMFWIINLVSYVLGLSFILFLIALFWQKFASKLRFFSDPKWKFKKVLGIIFIIIWISIFSWFYKEVETKLINEGYLWPIFIEQKILENIDYEKYKNKPEENKIKDEKEKKEFEVYWLKTNTAKSSIDLSLVLNWWPWKDWIPAINKPKFLDIKKAKSSMEYLKKDERWIVVYFDNIAKFYPFSILVWHEIVNDEIWKNKYSVTFCPLCWSSIVFDRVINWEEVLFWVSWQLYESNLLMYDNISESLWSQSLWKALIWDMIWQELEIVKTNVMSLEKFQENFKNWLVLSDDTWYSRSYWVVPYWDYDENDELIFSVQNEDERFRKKDIFYIVNDSWNSLAFKLDDLVKRKKAVINIWDLEYRASYYNWIVSVSKNEKIVNWYYEMWFSWITHNPWNKNVWSL